MCIRDLRDNGLIQLSAATFNNLSATSTVSLQENNLACYPYGSPAKIQSDADIVKCVSVSMAMIIWIRLVFN
jgi:hypothetical protein